MKMKSLFNLIIAGSMLAVLFSFLEKQPATSVLVFSKTNGFRHTSIEPGIEAIKKLGTQHQFTVDATEDSLAFTNENLAKYKAVIFLNTTGNVLGEAEQKAFENYIKKGGGFVGIHAATDCEYDWPWYVKMVGANFLSHPEQQVAQLVVKDNSHLSTKHLPATWERKDEWYNFKNINPAMKVLITINEGSYKGGANGDVHPMSWYHDYDGGKVFYTALGHTDASYSEPAFLDHVLGGIRSVLKK